MEQMMELMLAELNCFQAKMSAGYEKMTARLGAKIEDIKANQAKTESVKEEMNAKMGRHRRRWRPG
jgi:hypothetical protein